MINRRKLLAGATASGLTMPFLLKATLAAESGLPLPIPSVVSLDGTGNSVDAIYGSHSFLANGNTRTMGYGQDYLGPVLRMKRGQTSKISVGNKTNNPITAHWHGLHVPGKVDGGPQLAFGPGETWSPELDIDQPAATLWYHSHVHGQTADQVYAGLAGMIILDDPDAGSDGLPDTYGVDDIPLIVQDKAFNDDASLLYVKRGPSLMHGFRAGQILVNGAIRPSASVPSGLVRFRLLNASNARIYTFRFEDNRSFHQVASDGGLLGAPSKMSSLVLAPAERAEIVVDFSDGKAARLVSLPDANNPMGGGMMGGMMSRMMGGDTGEPEPVTSNDEFEIMTFDVDQQKLGAVRTLPTTFASAPKPLFGEPVRRRRFELNMHTSGGGMMGNMGINDKPMSMDRIDERVRLGETEIWEVFANEMEHPFHIHGTSFQVLSHNGVAVDMATTGLKDVFLVNGIAELLVQFNKPADEQTPYMFHCHILEHEDAGMMGQFTVA